MDKIKEIIVNYCKTEDRNPFALMIDGKWGSGKTYFFKEVLKEKIEEESDKKILYISLNGVSSFSEIYDQLVNEKFKLVKFFEENKVARISAKIFKSATNILLNAARIKNDTDNFGDINPKSKDAPSFTAQEIADFSKNIIVFDDIERLSNKLSILDILGFINTNFVEHDGIKVIIIGDSSEIKKKQKKFNEQKEKVIGRILQFTPTIEEVLDDYLEKITPGFPYRQFLELEKKFLLKRIEQAKITNLRTFFFFLDSFRQIFDKLDKNEINYLGEKILLFTLVCCNEFKEATFDKMKLANRNKVKRNLSEVETTTKNSDIVKNANRVSLNYSNEFREKYYDNSGYFLLRYDSIEDYIFTGVLKESLLNKELKHYLPDTITPEVEALRSISYSKIDNLSDEDFICNLEIILKALKEGSFMFQQFVDTARLFEGLLYLGYTINEQLVKDGANEKYWIENFEKIEGKKDNKFLSFSIRHDYNKEPYLKVYPKFSKLLADYNQKLIQKASLEGIKNEFKEFKESPSSFSSKNSPHNAFEFFPRFLIELNDELASFIIDLIKTDSTILIHIVLICSDAYSKEVAGWLLEKRDLDKEKDVLFSLRKKLNVKLENIDLAKRPLTKKRVNDLLKKIDQSISTLEQWIKEKEDKERKAKKEKEAREKKENK